MTVKPGDRSRLRVFVLDLDQGMIETSIPCVIAEVYANGRIKVRFEHGLIEHMGGEFLMLENGDRLCST